jgi:hypothetical protein
MSGKNGPFGHTIVSLHISEHVLYNKTEQNTQDVSVRILQNAYVSFTRYQQGTVQYARFCPLLSSPTHLHNGAVIEVETTIIRRGNQGEGLTSTHK